MPAHSSHGKALENEWALPQSPLLKSKRARSLSNINTQAPSLLSTLISVSRVAAVSSLKIAGSWLLARNVILLVIIRFFFKPGWLRFLELIEK